MKKLVFALFFLCAVNLFAQSQDLPELYDPENITQIEITFTESNWQSIMDGYKSNSDKAEEECNHDHEDERLAARVVVNGAVFEGAGVKFKGNSTYTAGSSKNPLNIKLDYTNDDLEYQGHGTLKLSNIKSDPSYVREVLAYEILRDYMAGPRSNFARVYINGNLYGLFTLSESINSDFAKKHFDYSKPDAIFKCNPGKINFMGGGGLPSLEYISNDTSDYKCPYQRKSPYGYTQLLEFINTLNNNFQNIESILDIDKAIWMIAFNNVTVNLDSYSGQFQQNYYLVWDSNDRICPVVWDLNMSFGSFTMSGGQGGIGGDLKRTSLFLHENDQNFPLINKLLQNSRYRKMYVAHCKTIMNDYFDSGLYKERGAFWQNVISNAVDQNADGTTYQAVLDGFDNTAGGGIMGNVVGITELMEGRRSYYSSEAEYTAQQPEITSIDAPEETNAFQDIQISANISNASYAYIGYRHSKDEIFTKVEMSSNGNTWTATIPIDEKYTHYYIYAENNQAGIFSPQRAEHEYYKIYGKTTFSINQDLVINEILSSNTMSETDEAGEYEDWIEIYNNTDKDINLKDYYLTDNFKEPAKWQFPDTIIPANGYVIVWADENGSEGPMHANFKLSAAGEEVGLTNKDYEIVDSLTFSNIFSDLTLARIPNGTGEFVLGNSTFGANNTGKEDPPKPVKEINLKEGWNLVGYPFLESATIENGFSSIWDELEVVKDTESFYEKSGNNITNLLKELKYSRGYLIKVSSDCVLVWKK